MNNWRSRQFFSYSKSSKVHLQIPIQISTSYQFIWQITRLWYKTQSRDVFSANVFSDERCNPIVFRSKLVHQSQLFIMHCNELLLPFVFFLSIRSTFERRFKSAQSWTGVSLMLITQTTVNHFCARVKQFAFYVIFLETIFLLLNEPRKVSRRM